MLLLLLAWGIHFHKIVVRVIIIIDHFEVVLHLLCLIELLLLSGGNGSDFSIILNLTPFTIFSRISTSCAYCLQFKRRDLLLKGHNLRLHFRLDELGLGHLLGLRESLKLSDFHPEQSYLSTFRHYFALHLPDLRLQLPDLLSLLPY